MVDADLAARIEEIQSVDPDEFQRRVAAGAEAVEAAVADGALDNPQAIVGLEHEFYAVESDSKALARVPRRLLAYAGFEKELGLHNAEMSTSPQPLNAAGLRAQEAEVIARLETAREPVGAEGLQLVSDGLWTIPPVGETARSYLTDSVEIDGVRVATNMSDAARYHAMSDPNRPAAAGMHLDAPHVHLEADTAIPESLITSIQPHYQVPQARDIPDYVRYALRIAGPLLALGVNAPLFPPDLYDEDAPPREILADARMEERIWVFENVLNDPDGEGKVRFPRDVDSVKDAIWRIVDDKIIVPMPAEETGRFDDDWAAFRTKHGTFWRWVRPVFEGASRRSAHARIEFRPIPGQPTVRDVIGFQAAFAGLLEALPRLEHPVADLPWARARENFYAAARDGLDADLTWITTDGDRVCDPDAIYADLFEHAETGLRYRGLTETEISRYLGPLRTRARNRLTPARWKLQRVHERLDDGAGFEEAVTETQRAYVDRQEESLLTDSFADWIVDETYTVE